jgi:hypothetical protein
LHHEHLIEQARTLVRHTTTTGRPRQADLRRAVSSAYYALFHFLIDVACREFLGTAHKDRSLRNIMTRAFVHGDMADASRTFKGGTLPSGMAASFGPIPRNLSTIAGTFLDLQDERHRADYDLAATFHLQQVNLMINRVETAMTDWETIRQQPTARLYLVLLLTWKQVKTKKF